ncbi:MULTISPECIES: helix-turn-helix domain-containing protein [unclassified Variovorax]|uniref:helix-turn-helix domain-containing protein n=1 Tax=unclassified Variovorax TaxID=663243 RepID=UPI002577F666|nr:MULTISPECIES: helix-turn-helix domain-containing protein [unclassified Variovorax]MDM0090292.1 helix-turn-helix domain-containing protein [Variovorax sp. J22G40]MDM0148042.1 helix-turn-helix domain-containing protein [Variovorax sp. J2P1-31]
MSIKVMTMVFDRYPEGGNERLLALAMADHARDDGTRIWPSLEELSRKTLQSRRTVQRQIAKMVEAGWLEPVRAANGRPGGTNEYRINAAWIAGEELPKRGVNLTPVSAGEVIHTGVNLTPLEVIHTGVTSDERGVTSDARGDIAVTPESSEPSRTVTPLPPDGGAAGFEGIASAYPNKANRCKAERRWMRLRPDAALEQQMLAAIEAQSRTPKWRKDGGQFVPELATWLRNRCWLDDTAAHVGVDWWNSIDGVKAMGERLGMVFSLSALGNAYTDDEQNAHWRRYRTSVLLAAGAGPWSERRIA